MTDMDAIARGIANMDLTRDELIYILGYLSREAPEQVSEALKSVLEQRDTTCQGGLRLVDFNGQEVVMCLYHANESNSPIIAYRSSQYRCIKGGGD